MTPGAVYSYRVEYRMDPSRLKETIFSLSHKSKCVDVIKEILNEQQNYIKKCTNAKILMEKNIVKILKKEEYKGILLQ